MSLFSNISYYFFNKKHPNLFTYDEYLEFLPYSNLFLIDDTRLRYRIDYNLTYVIDRIYLEKDIDSNIWSAFIDYKESLLYTDTDELITADGLGKIIDVLLERLGDKVTRVSDHYTTRYIRQLENKLLSSSYIINAIIQRFIRENSTELEFIIAPFKDMGMYSSHQHGFIEYNDPTYNTRIKIDAHTLRSKMGVLITLISKDKDVNDLKLEVEHLKENMSILHPSYKIDLVEVKHINNVVIRTGLKNFSLLIYMNIPLRCTY